MMIHFCEDISCYAESFWTPVPRSAIQEVSALDPELGSGFGLVMELVQHYSPNEIQFIGIVMVGKNETRVDNVPPPFFIVRWNFTDPLRPSLEIIPRSAGAGVRSLLVWFRNTDDCPGDWKYEAFELVDATRQ